MKSNDVRHDDNEGDADGDDNNDDEGDADGDDDNDDDELQFQDDVSGLRVFSLRHILSQVCHRECFVTPIKLTSKGLEVQV